MQSSVDSELTQQFRKKATKALNKVGEELGMDGITLGTIRYDRDSFHCTLKGRVLPVNASGAKMSKDQADWNKFCRSYNITESDWNKTVSISDKTFRLVSIKGKRKETKKRQLSFVIKDLNDESEGTRVTTADAVRNALGKRKRLEEEAKARMEELKKPKTQDQPLPSGHKSDSGLKVLAWSSDQPFPSGQKEQPKAPAPKTPSVPKALDWNLESGGDFGSGLPATKCTCKGVTKSYCARCVMCAGLK